MKLKSSKEFAVPIEKAWEALHQTARLDVEPGSTVKMISDTQWEAHNSDTGSVTLYTASFDEENRKVTIEGASSKKQEHDFICLMLEETAEERVKLDIEVKINTGAHFVAKVLGVIIAKPAQEIITRHIYHNFEALCTGKETKTMTAEELKALAKEKYEK